MNKEEREREEEKKEKKIGKRRKFEIVFFRNEPCN